MNVDGRVRGDRERVNKLESKFHQEIKEACVDVALRRMRDEYRAQVAAIRRKNSRNKMELYHNWWGRVTLTSNLSHESTAVVIIILSDWAHLSTSSVFATGQ